MNGPHSMDSNGTYEYFAKMIIYNMLSECAFHNSTITAFVIL